MIRTTLVIGAVAYTFLAFTEIAQCADRRGVRATGKATVHPLRTLAVDDAMKALTATLSSSDRNVIIAPNARTNSIHLQAPANRVRQFQRLLKSLDRPDRLEFGLGGIQFVY